VLPRLGTSARAPRATACSLAETHFLDEWKVSVFAASSAKSIAGLFAGLWTLQSPATPVLITLRSRPKWDSILATPAGIEPATFSLEDRRSKWQLR